MLSNQHIDLYNAKLMLSCVKLTPTLEIVTPTRVITLEEEDGTQKVLVAQAATVAIAIAEIAQLLIIHLKEK